MNFDVHTCLCVSVRGKQSCCARARRAAACRVSGEKVSRTPEAPEADKCSCAKPATRKTDDCSWSAGMLNVAEARADLITSFFWTSFTVGRFGSVGLERAFPTHPFAVMAVQIWVLQCGWMLVVGMPSSEGALWLSSLLVGGGVGGLFAGFIGQLSCRVHFSSFVGGCMGLGAMSGVALWNTTAAALGAHTATLVVAAASLVTVACQALLVPLFRRADRKKTDCKRRTEDPDVC